MRATYVVHIVAGTIALLSGYVALFAAKGATVHRRSGLAFVYAMLTMSVGGMLLASMHGVWCRPTDAHLRHPSRHGWRAPQRHSRVPVLSVRVRGIARRDG